MILTIRNRFLIALAWGPRRITSRTRYGPVESAYPPKVTAAFGLWMHWLRRGLVQWMLMRVQIVVPHVRAKRRILDAIAGTAPVRAPVLTDAEIADLFSQRIRLRAERRFAEADAIRDRLTAAGVQVNDISLRAAQQEGEHD